MPIAKINNCAEKLIQRRSKGEKTREKILVSAIRVLAVNGIKGTTHRAIASDANIQLSLTTYYFKDIQELVQQAFQLNSDYLRERTANILQKVFTEFSYIDKASLEKVAVKEVLREKLAEMTALFLFSNLKKESISLAVEQLMFTAVQVSPELKKLAQEHKESQLIPFTQLAKYFNDHDPEVDAQIMKTLFSQLQYSQLSLQPSEISIKPIQQVTRKLIGWIMGL